MDYFKNTSTVTCNYMNVCLIEYKDGGICTNLSANTALDNQNLSIVPFVKNSYVSCNTSVVTAFTSYNASLSGYSINRCTAYHTSMITYVDT